MKTLYKDIEKLVNDWRINGFSCPEYPLIAEILKFNRNQNGIFRLREAQLCALETYWYLRIELKTPTFEKLYKELYPKKSDFYEAIGINSSNPEFVKMIMDEEDILEKIKVEDEFAQKYKLESLRESLDLKYPSYILSLAMGAGKTILMGAIITTEFAMALEYGNNGEIKFMENALVFAPGTTIIESLREISELPFEKILPARLYRKFIANLKIIYTSKDRKEIAVEDGGVYNLIITNTEKIMIRKQKKKGLFNKTGEEQEYLVNQRLKKLTSLPNLGVFSDEAHHTYGQDLDEDLKRVRQTINHLNENKELVCVINTTGTPYYKSQTLKDVVFWYGLSQGIEDNILKSLENGIQTYDFQNNELEESITSILENFFEKYGDVKIYNGAKSKIAFYFPNEESLEESRPFIENSITKIGLPITSILKNTQKSNDKTVAEFNSLNDPSSNYRVILLINKGTEGWNCPSLFATALLRKMKSSNNFLLQASTRCLRQVPDNIVPATIYLHTDNAKILDKELKETYGTSLKEINKTEQKTEERKVIIRKTNLPKFSIKKKIRTVKEKSDINYSFIKFVKPDVEKNHIVISHATLQKDGLKVVGGIETIESEHNITVYEAGCILSENYRIPYMLVIKSLKLIYCDGVPENHLTDLAQQIENQIQRYEVIEEEIEEALVLIKMNDSMGRENFEQENGEYYTTIRFKKGGDKDFLDISNISRKNDFGFHFTPYNFDSSPEKEFFKKVLPMLDEKPEDIYDIYFTGSITNREKTDFFFEYKGEDGLYHEYFPDFLVHRKDGTGYIVEIKGENRRSDITDGENGFKKQAMTELLKLNKDKFKYEMIFVKGDSIPENKYINVQDFIRKGV